MFVSGIHKVIFDEFESGITNTYEQNNNKMNANLAKVSFIKHIGFINRANEHDSSEITGKDYKSFVRLAVLGEPILDPRALSFSNMVAILIWKTWGQGQHPFHPYKSKTRHRDNTQCAIKLFISTIDLMFKK